MAPQRAAILAPVCVLLVLFSVPSFIASNVRPRLPNVQDAEPRASSRFEGFGASTSATIALAAVTAFAAHALRSRVIRYGRIVGTRDDLARIDLWEEGELPPRVRNYYYGQLGFKKNEIDPRHRDKEPARMKLSHVTEAAAIFKTQDFYKADFAEMDAASVKEVGSYQVTAEGKVAIPANVPEYRPIKRARKRLEKEPGEKRPPVGNEEYVEYVDEKCNLYDMAKEAAPAALGKDIICDRGSLLTLLDFVSETLTPFLMKKGQHSSAVDLVKISKSGKALVLEKLLDVDKMLAEFVPYRGGWKREEVSNHGNFKPAMTRLAKGDGRTRSMMCTGLSQVAGSRAGDHDECFRFVEFELGGLSFLTKARAHFQKDGQNLDIQHKNMYYQNEVKALTTYFKMLLGKTDKNIMVLQRSGKVVEVVESTLDSIAEKQPVIKEAAHRRLGRLVTLLKEVQKAVDSDGPWVLQWQRGQLILGKYELVEVEELATA